MNAQEHLIGAVKIIVVHCAPVAIGSELYRVILEIRAIDPPSERGKLIKEYEIWVTEEKVEDSLKLYGVGLSDVDKFAVDYFRQRYMDSQETVPEENGAFISNSTGEIKGNPRAFWLKLSEEDKRRKIKTTMMIPEDTLQWLREYSVSKGGIGVGESVRRLVADFQAGTVNPGQGQTNLDNSLDNSGVPPIG